MSDVFISYKRQWRPRVLGIAEALKALKISVWFDTEITAGESFGPVINAEIEAARAVLVCWTTDAFARDGQQPSWVEAEANLGLRKRALVPVMLEETPLSAPWNVLHTESLADWTPLWLDHPGWLKTLTALGKLLGRPGLAEYQKLIAARSPEALAEWAAKYPNDPLAVAPAGGGGLPPKPAAFIPDRMVLPIAAIVPAAVTLLTAIAIQDVQRGLMPGLILALLGAVLGVPLALAFHRLRIFSPAAAISYAVAHFGALGVSYFIIYQIANTFAHFDNSQFWFGMAAFVLSLIAGTFLLFVLMLLGAFPNSRPAMRHFGVAAAAAAIVAAIAITQTPATYFAFDAQMLLVAAAFQLVFGVAVLVLRRMLLPARR